VVPDITSELGNRQTGTGLLLDMGKAVTVSSVQLKLGGQPGAAVQVRVGNTAVLDDMFIVSSATDVGGRCGCRRRSRRAESTC